MQRTKPAIETDAVPVEYAIGRVAVLLHLDDEVARADRVNSAAGNEDRVTGTDRYSVDELSDGAVMQRALKIVPSYPCFEPGVNVSAKESFQKVPHLRLRLATKTAGDLERGMHLE